MPVKPTKGGGWDVSVCCNYQRVHRRLPKGASARDARALEAELLAALSRKAPAIPGDPRLSDLMAAYMLHADTLRGPGPAKFAALRIGRWVEGRRASEARFVAAKIIADMTGHYKPATINKSLGTLKKACRIAYMQGLTPQNYGDPIKLLPENNQRTRTLTLGDVKRLADCASENVRAAIWVSLYTGCRRGEVCAIKAENIGAEYITLDAGMTKTERTRLVPIIPQLRPWLKFLPLPISVRGLESGFKNARDAAGIKDVTFHDLRRSCATLMLAAGVDMPEISKLLGHSSTRVTEARYAHLQMDRVAAGLALAFAPAVTPRRRKAA